MHEHHTLTCAACVYVCSSCRRRHGCGPRRSARRVEPGSFRPEGGVDDQRGAWPRTRLTRCPTFGSNDRSRWVTVRALVDDGTYVVGHRDREVTLVSSLTRWRAGRTARAVSAAAGQQLRSRAIRVMSSRTAGGRSTRCCNPDALDYYSSKPPLLPTLAAGEYWLLKQAFGWSITGELLGSSSHHPPDVQRPAVGPVLGAAGPAGRTLRHNRLGPALRRHGGLLRHAADAVPRYV